MNIIEFLLARIAEDEAVARDATIQQDVTWGDLNDSPLTLGEYDHARRWSPARVLAECEAKRRIVEVHQGLLTAQRQLDGDELGETITRSGAVVSEGVLRLLAAVYADHPDYDPAWRP